METEPKKEEVSLVTELKDDVLDLVGVSMLPETGSSAGPLVGSSDIEEAGLTRENS